MKNNFFIFILVYFLISLQILYADSFQFNVKDISIENEGNIIFANNGKAISKNKNLEIVAKKDKYIKIGANVILNMILCIIDPLP